MAGLFIADQIARTAYIKVVAGQLKACTKAIEIGQNFQAFLGDFAKHAVSWLGQIGISSCF